jgi:hypothetical protein
MAKDLTCIFKHRFHLLSITFIGLLLFACQTKDESKSLPLLEEVGSASFGISDQVKSIELDEFTGAVYEINGITDQNEYFFFNKYNQSIYVYDLKSEPQKPKRIIKVPLDESINFNMVSDLVYHNADSIFIWDDRSAYGNSPELFLINSNGEVMDTFKVLDRQNGDPGKAGSFETSQGRSMLYHEGKIILLSSISRDTKEDNWKPLIIYEIKSRSTSYHGAYPEYFQDVKFGQNKWKSNYCLIPELNQVVISFPFESNLFIFDLEDNSWTELGFNSNMVASPKQFDANSNSPEIDYLLSNSWYYGLEYDRANGLIWRTAQIGKQNDNNDLPPRGDNTNNYITSNDDFYSFLTDLNSKSYWVLPGFHWLETQFLHPKDGPYKSVKRQSELGLNPEDYLVFSPLILGFENGKQGGLE